MNFSHTLRHGLYALCWVIILATLATMGVGYYFLFVQGNPPIEFLNMPFPVDKKVYHPGDTITMLVNYDRHISALVTRSTYLNDSYPIPLELSTDGDVTPTGTGTVLLTYVIPPSYVPAQGDDYYISGTSIYHVNFLRDRIVTWKSETFRIEPASGVSPRPSVHRPVQGTEVKDQSLIDLIERSHSSSSSVTSQSSSATSSSATALSASASASSPGLPGPLLDDGLNAVQAVDRTVPAVLPLPRL